MKNKGMKCLKRANWKLCAAVVPLQSLLKKTLLSAYCHRCVCICTAHSKVTAACFRQRPNTELGYLVRFSSKSFAKVWKVACEAISLWVMCLSLLDLVHDVIWSHQIASSDVTKHVPVINKYQSNFHPSCYFFRAKILCVFTSLY